VRADGRRGVARVQMARAPRIGELVRAYLSREVATRTFVVREVTWLVYGEHVDDADAADVEIRVDGVPT
jgi:hypothetical protein